MTIENILPISVLTEQYGQRFDASWKKLKGYAQSIQAMIPEIENELATGKYGDNWTLARWLRDELHISQSYVYKILAEVKGAVDSEELEKRKIQAEAERRAKAEAREIERLAKESAKAERDREAAERKAAKEAAKAEKDREAETRRAELQVKREAAAAAEALKKKERANRQRSATLKRNAKEKRKATIADTVSKNVAISTTCNENSENSSENQEKSDSPNENPSSKLSLVPLSKAAILNSWISSGQLSLEGAEDIHAGRVTASTIEFIRGMTESEWQDAMVAQSRAVA